MKLYIFSIVISDLLILVMNLLGKAESGLGTGYIIYASISAAVFVIAIDGGVAAFVRRCLPEKWFTYKVQFHNASKGECALYEKLGIKLWKDYVIELGTFTNFSKKTVAEPDSREYIEKFILECNYGAVIHLASVFVAYVLVFFYPLEHAMRFAVPAATVSGILNLLPYMILRYNVARLQRVRAVLEKKELRARGFETESSEGSSVSSSVASI